MKTDIILPMTDECMQQIVQREKVTRLVRVRDRPARTRCPGDPPLPEDGIGNRRFNERHPDMDRWDFAYRVRSVRQLRSPVSLEMLMKKYGVGIAPRGMIYTPVKLLEDVPWLSQNLLWSDVEDRVPTQVVRTIGDAEVPSVSKDSSAKSAKKHAVPEEPHSETHTSQRQRRQLDAGT
ncbi:uncharacterized protein B0H18DRAFT_1008700 [Fomitopsis serialis]|uniref:uncharacterized protein n=1 Tax=Fomitopsis serialis TaxID=139415 RepID=UPI0020077827|nr:uncharacterized protein B0H18DRAFT_1008700 [Neoantrodia serialis]KAH9925491.1 hypothetical protein B0H18DRAFT_1008700 [Neoantrodia serialis]